MKTEEQVNLARMQLMGLMRFTADADLDPRKRGAFTGMYAALSWVLGLPNKEAGQMAALLAGAPGDRPVPPQALDLTLINPLDGRHRPGG